MELPPLQRQVRAADLPLDRLAVSTNVSQADKVAELSRQFEAVLVRQILREAQKPVISSSFNRDSAARGIYQEMMIGQLADGIATGGNLGVSAALRQQLGRQTQSHSPAGGGLPAPGESAQQAMSHD